MRAQHITASDKKIPIAFPAPAVAEFMDEQEVTFDTIQQALTKYSFFNPSQNFTLI